MSDAYPSCMAATQVWHGNKKCAVNGAKLPKANRVLGQACPFCGNTIGAYIGSTGSGSPSATSPTNLGQRAEQLIANDPSLSWRQAWGRAERERFAEDGADSGAAPSGFAPSLYDDRTAKPIWQRPPVIAVGVVTILVAGVLIFNGGDSGGSDSSARTETATQGAMSEVEGTLLGDAWIGSGNYTVHATAKAYNAAEDFTAFAARISAPGADDLCLYWYPGGQTFGDGLTIGDTVTRAFSDWGSAASADSPAADLVRSSGSTPEGRAVIAKVGC